MDLDKATKNKNGEQMTFKERILWAPHNLIAHPLMVFLPSKWGNWIHDKTTISGT